MTSIESQPRLRLVGAEDEWADEPRLVARRRADEVARENRSAASNSKLSPTDPRWVLAVRAYSQLQGSTLTFDRRQRVMATARQLGVRPFDANLVIAIVQDHARRGRRLPSAAGALALLEAPAPQRRRRTWIQWLSALAAAVVANAFLIWWLTA